MRCLTNVCLSFVMVWCLAQPAVAGDLINGDFEDGLSGWTTHGPVSTVGIDDHWAYFQENPAGFTTDLYQVFNLPSFPGELSFLYLLWAYGGPSSGPPETLGVYVLDPDTLLPLLPVSLEEAVSVLNVGIDGNINYDPDVVTVTEPDEDGVRLVTVDLSSLPGGREVYLRYTLLSWGDEQTVWLAVDDVVVTGVQPIPTISEWGLTTLALLMSAALVLVFGRREALQV